MDRRRVGRTRSNRDVSPPSSRTRSKSPARVEISGRDSAPIKNLRSKKTDSEEISSSSQSSTPKKLKVAKKDKPVAILDDSGDNEEVANIYARSTRLATLRKRSPTTYKNTPTPSDDLKRSVSRTVSSLTKEDSGDEEEEDEEEVQIVPNKHNDFQSLGIYTKPLTNFLLLFILAISPICLLIIKSKTDWQFSSLIAEAKKFENFCSLQAFLLVIGIHILSGLTQLLPVGRIVRLPDAEKEYKFNGILSTFLLIGLLFALELKNLDALTFIYDNIDRILVCNVLKNIYISTVMYFYAKYQPSSDVNTYAKSGKFLIDFVAGRELNPIAFKLLDVKRNCYVQAPFYLLLINITLLFKNVTIPIIEISNDGSPINELIKDTYSNLVFIIKNSEFNAAGFVVSGLLILYALDLLIYEHHLAASYQLNNEGCGAEILLRFATFPFLLSFLPRYLFANKIAVNGYILAFASIIFIIGLTIKRGSNSLKYEYRLHPNDSKFKDLATLPTFQNRRLIIGKWWSKIRQPNLFGEILLHLALLNLLAPSFDCVSFFGILIIIEYLIYRSIGINRKNAVKYESSWQRYTSAVKYNLLPRVY